MSTAAKGRDTPRPQSGGEAADTAPWAGGALPRFRQDLAVTPRDRGPRGKVFVVRDPDTGEQYEVDEQAYFLCQSFDGHTTPEEIVERFNRFFGREMTVGELAGFARQALASGLLRPGTAGDLPGRGRQRRNRPVVEAGDMEEEAGEDEGGRVDPYKWSLFDPGDLFATLARWTRPFRPLVLFLVYSLVVTVPLAVISFFDNEALMRSDLALLGESRSYFGRLIFSLVVINLMRCVIQGTVCAHYGGTVRKFGIKLRFGLIPRFFIDKSAIKKFDRSARLWTYGSNPLFRLVLVVAGVGMWHLSHGTGTRLAADALVLTHAALISFLLVCLPLRASDGYRWMVTYFRLPLSLLRLAVMAVLSLFTRKPLPSSISPQTRRRLVLYGLTLFAFWTYAFFRITSHVTAGLADSFPDLFGESTEFLIGAFVVLMVFRWGFNRFRRMGAGSSAEPAAVTLSAAEPAPTPWQSRLLRLGILAAGATVLALPYPYRPGGEVTLLPPVQQQVQAPISGRVEEVYYAGGDGRVLPAGTVIATMVSTDLENEILTLQEEVAGQEAELAGRRAVLAQLLAGARPEEIRQARARLAEAREEVRLAERQLRTARLTAEHSSRELERLQGIPGGLIPDSEVAEAEARAGVDRSRVREYEASLEARRKSAARAEAELALLLSGPTEEQIEAARQDVAAAEAELRRLRQELAYARSQSSSARLQMPFEGFLVDSFLTQKVGQYLNRGETFATAQVHQPPLVEMMLPEFDVADIRVGQPAEVKLMAYPTAPLAGTVLSIEPSGSESDFGQAFQVVIQLSEADHLLKTGMTGYAKVESGERPLIVLLARPLIRFAMIELWSWMP